MELREALADERDLVVLYVLADRQVNEKTRRFVSETGLRDRVRFVIDPGSAAIEVLGLLKEDPEEIEVGVPHPATYLVDRQGILRMADVRRDYHVWLDAAAVIAALEKVP